MPNPTPGAVHVNGLLTDLSVAWLQSSTKAVANKVFPFVPVDKQSDIIPEYDRGDFYRIAVERRAPGSKPAQSGYRTEHTQSYNAVEWALDHPIDDSVAANADAPYNPEMDATRWLTQQMMLRQEKEWVTSFFSTGDLWTGSSDGADLVAGSDYTAWSNAASTPVEDVDNHAAIMESQTGELPNTLVVQRKVWFALKEHPDIVDRVKHTSDEPVTPDIVARLMGLEKIVISGLVENTGGEGSTAADSFSYLAGKHALLAHSAPEPGLYQPSAGYTFVWSGLVGGAQDGVQVSDFRHPYEIGDIVRIKSAWDQKRIAADLGVMFLNASTRA